jgi:glyoxylase-like metal-dependent hydrolase (beta-lactamase superfamily II)
MRLSGVLAASFLAAAFTIGGASVHAQEAMFLAVPDNAAGPAIDQEKGFVVEEIGRGLYHLNDGVYQMMFLTTGEGVIVVDAPPNTGEKILTAIASVTDEPITHVIYSHTHNDHIAAAGLYPKGVEIIAHEEVAAHLAGRNDPNRPAPTRTFSDTLRLEVGNQTLELAYKGVNHAPGNIFIYAPEQKVLMLVDIVFPGWTPFRYLALAEDVDGFLAAHDQILEYDFDHFIGGHVNRSGTRADVETQKAYFQDIVAAAGKANGAMDFGAAYGEAAERGGANNIWAIFSIALGNLEQQCADEVTAKWGDKLGGVDVFTVTHCAEIASHQRLD